MPKPSELTPPRSVKRDPSGSDVAIDFKQICPLMLTGLTAALFFTRFFLPAESAAQGDTLWIAAAWMICGAVWGIGLWRGWWPRVQLGWQDAALALWIGGQIVSAILVVLTVGDKRSATNLAWEWVALWIIWLIVRHGVIERSARRAILRAMIITGTLLGGYGLYQHYISHPQLVAEYAPLFDRLRTATGLEAAAIKQKLARDGIPTEGAAAVLFEKRMRDSREPLALFALANTFGGLLAVCLVLTLGEILTLRQREARWRSLVPLLVATGIIGWCLLLTKSRTACIGSACGILALLISHAQLSGRLRLLALPIGLSVLAVIAATGLLFAVGGLDRQVLSEAPKSLAYRLRYWQATSQLIADHPWFGVGPGNFRQHYLKYKLPVASEEIADPHNLFFETAATGGVFSIGGLLIWLGLAFVGGYRRPEIETSGATSEAEVTRLRTGPSQSEISLIVFWMAGSGAFLAFAGQLGCWGEWEDRLIILAMIWGALAWVFNGLWPKSAERLDDECRDMLDHRALSSAMRAAAITLTVHLLGSGGISMPAITQTLLLLLAWSNVTRNTGPAPVRNPVHNKTRLVGLLFSGASLAALIGMIATALQPVIRSRALLTQATTIGMSLSANDRDSVHELYRRAGLADPWSPDPWRRRFEQALAEGGIQSNESFESAVQHLHEAMNRDPLNFWGPRNLGRLWFQRWQLTHHRSDAEQAVHWSRKGLELYPTNSEIQAELAVALASAGDRPAALSAARAALAQDEIYHKQGHEDRYLSHDVREQLQSLKETRSD